MSDAPANPIVRYTRTINGVRVVEFIGVGDKLYLPQLVKRDKP